MNRFIGLFFAFAIVFGSGACTSTPQAPLQETGMASPAPPTQTLASRPCKPTLDDGVSPSYTPDAPERTVVGKGHTLTGRVLSSTDCHPIPNARLEFWPEVEGTGHPDAERATFHADQDGYYRFECSPPHHIHMRISAPGYRTIGVNSYHPEGQTEGTFDIILEPE